MGLPSLGLAGAIVQQIRRMEVAGWYGERRYEVVVSVFSRRKNEDAREVGVEAISDGGGRAWKFGEGGLQRRRKNRKKNGGGALRGTVLCGRVTGKSV